MPSNYPGALDTLVNPTGSEFQDDPPHSDQHIDANDAIEAIQATLGIDPQSTHDDVAARLDQLETILGSSFGNGLDPTLIATGTAGGGLTISVTPSAAPAAGDLIIFMVATHNVVPNVAGPTQGTGAAWTERLRFDTDGGEWIACYTKIANGTEPATFDITTNSSSATLSGAAVVILRGLTTFIGSVYQDASLSSSPINGAPNGCLIGVWLSALAAGTLFDITSMDKRLAFRVASSEPAMMLATKPTTHSFIWGPFVATAPGISGTWLGNLMMIWE